jgi:hypothetical protein
MGELAGLDFRFKNSSSLFRKVMAKLDQAFTSGPSTGAPPPVRRPLRHFWRPFD